MALRARFKAGCAALTLVAVAALAGELVARARERSGARAAAVYEENAERRRIREAFHPDLWRRPWAEYAPGARVAGTVNGVELVASINSAGFRGPEWRRSSPMKIACLGASTTVIGDTDASTYPARLERTLRPSRDVEVWNCGVAGISDDGYAAVVDRILDAGSPDLVVEYGCVNDIIWRALPAWRERLGWRRFCIGSALVRLGAGDALLPDEETMRADLRRLTIAPLREVEAKLKARGSRFVPATFLHADVARLSSEDEARLDGGLRHHWHSRNVSFRAYARIVDLYDDELARAFDGLPLAREAALDASDFEDICHLTEDGLEKQARALAKLLEPALRR